jgi:hypothetical protein
MHGSHRHYNHQIVFVLLMLTHSDYDKPHWKRTYENNLQGVVQEDSENLR